MNEIDKKYKEVQIARMSAALLDMEYKIMQRHEEIKRLELEIEKQISAIESLKKQE